MTTNESVTEAQVQQLRAEAGEAGDAEQVRLCDLALLTWSSSAAGQAFAEEAEAAKAKCVKAINYAESMAE